MIVLRVGLDFEVIVTGGHIGKGVVAFDCQKMVVVMVVVWMQRPRALNACFFFFPKEELSRLNQPPLHPPTNVFDHDAHFILLFFFLFVYIP